ncbi:low-density lipoprotein receptor-related protein 2-like [Branchiostoma floridae x Branchiostoma belcheri]
MFWTDRHAETVSVARLDGRYVRTLVSQDVGTLGDIVVDPANGYMFWTDWGVNCRIERAAMDGTGRVVLISYIFGRPRGLAIDYTEQRIYWSDAAYRTIQSVDLSGQKFNQIHLTTFRQAGFFGLALDNLNMYWTAWNVPYVVVTPKSSSNTHHALASGFPSPNGIYVNRTDAGAIPSSACSLSNGGCRELCLARPGGRTCACRNSWALQNDSASCSPIVPVSPSFLWIDRERTFDTSSVVMLAGDSSTVRGSPGSFPVTTLLTVQPPSYIDAIDYDFRLNLLFWVNPGQKKIYMTNFRLGTHRAIVHGISNAVKHLAVDWLNQNLYYTDGVYNWIGMVNYNTSHHHVIIQTQLDRPRGTVVHPVRGFLFWNDWGKEPKIERATLSGQNRTVVVKENLQRPSGMVIDYDNDRLFWADTGLDVIESCDLDGSNRRNFYALPGTLFYDITFDGREIVIADWYHDRLIFANGTDEMTVGDSEDAYIFGVEFYDESRQPWIQSECQINNGDCQHTCVGGLDQHTCLCLPGYDLAKDKHTCIETGHSFSSALLVATDDGIMTFPHNIADLHTMADLNFTYVVQGHKVIAIDYDYAGKMLFYIQEGDNGTQSIQRLELLGQNDSFNIYTSGDGIDCIAVDWVSSNLYWTETLSDRICVSRLDGSFRHVLIDNLNQPRGLAVHPPERLLFWTEVGRISSASLAGTNRRTVVPYNMNSEPIGIAIDLENDRLYWVDSLQGTMQSCNLTGGDVLVHWQADYVGLYGVTTFKDYVLWTDNTNHVIRMGVNNAVGQFVTTRLTELSTKPYGIRMYHEFQQMLYTGPCDLINGGCEGLCLPTPGSRICRCGHGGYLQPDGQSCWPDAPVTLPNSSPTPTTATAILPSTTATTTREPVALSTKTSTPTPAPAISSTVTTLTSASAISSTTTTTTPDPAISTTATTPKPAPAISSTTTTPTLAPAFSTTTTTPTSSAAISSTTTRPTPAPAISSTTTTLTSSPAISTTTIRPTSSPAISTTTRPTSSPAISSKTTTPTPAPVILSTTTTTTPAFAISSTPTTPTAAPAILSATTIKTTQAPAVARTTTTQIPQPVASSTTTTTPTPATAAISPPATTTTTPTPPAIFSSTATATLAPTPGLTLFSSTTTTQLPTISSSTTSTTTSAPTISPSTTSTTTSAPTIPSSTTTTRTSAPPAFSSTTATTPTPSPLAILSPFTTTTSTKTTSKQALDSTPLKSSSPIVPTFGETCPQGQTIVVGLPADANGRAYVNTTITAWDRNGQVLEVRGNPGLPGYITYSPEPQHVVLEATDGRGMTTSCSFIIIVKDTHPPRLLCPADIIHQSETPDDCIEWDEPIPEDNSGQTVSLTSNHGPGVRFLRYGVYTVTYTAVDGAGNQANCDFTISLQSEFCGFLL